MQGDTCIKVHKIMQSGIQTQRGTYVAVGAAAKIYMEVHCQ